MLVQTVDTDRGMATHRFQDFTRLQSRQNSVVQLNLDGIVCIPGANVPPCSCRDVKNKTALLAKPWQGHTILWRTYLTMQIVSISISCQILEVPKPWLDSYPKVMSHTESVTNELLHGPQLVQRKERWFLSASFFNGCLISIIPVWNGR